MPTTAKRLHHLNCAESAERVAARATAIGTPGNAGAFFAKVAAAHRQIAEAK